VNEAVCKFDKEGNVELQHFWIRNLDLISFYDLTKPLNLKTHTHKVFAKNLNAIWRSPEWSKWV